MSPTEIVAGKAVYVVENHACVLHAWGTIREHLGVAPLLISLDHHVDTLPAFNTAMCSDGHFSLGARTSEWSLKYCQNAGLVNGAVPPRATERLLHDEHIDAAIVGGVIDYAFVVSFQRGDPTVRKVKASYLDQLNYAVKHAVPPPEDCPFEQFDIPENRIFELEPTCGPRCEEDGHQDCERKQADAALESEYLTTKVSDIYEMGEIAGLGNVFQRSFILDFDLDYFHTCKAINPENPDVLYQLIRECAAITIATEPACVLKRRLNGEEVTAEWLLERLMQHIHKALAP